MNWQTIIEGTKKRRDYNGLEIKAHFGDYPPFCICPTKSIYGGAFLDTLNTAAKILNLTVVIQPPLDENWNIWAKRYLTKMYSKNFNMQACIFLVRLPNGTYLGMIREIIDNRVDTSIAGFTRDVDRNEVVDFTPGIFKSILTIVIRKPSRNDFSMRYFVLEFTPISWAFLLLVYTLCFVCFSIVTYILMYFNVENTTKGSKYESGSMFKKALKSSLEVCLRAFISKVSFFPPNT